MTEPYYHDERHGITLYLGDCRDILPTLDAVDHVITDPPYARDVYVRVGLTIAQQGSGDTHQRLGLPPKTKKGSGTPARMGIGNHQYSSSSIEKLGAGEIGFIDEMLDAVALELARVTQRWVLVFSDAESIHLWREQLELAGMRYVRTGAWVKPDSMPQFSGDRPSVGFEPCTITHAQGPMRWNGNGLPALWTFFTAKGDARPDHPCPKPLPLMTRLVEQFSDPGETILDPFAGSGTTLVAAKTLGRKAIGIELEERWAEAAAKRIEATPTPLFVLPPERGEQAVGL